MVNVVYLVISIISFVLLKYVDCLYEGDFCTLQSTGASGQCQLLKQCQPALQALQSRVFPQNCGFQGFEPVVCCPGGAPMVTRPPPTTLAVSPVSEKSPPKNNGYVSNDILNRFNRYCGRQHRDDYYDPGENITIDEFPWITRLIVKRTKGDYNPGHSLCTGTLINHRYVLTTAECLENFPLIDTVRLGDFNQRSETDCVEYHNLNVRECSQYVDGDIEEKIIHPFRISWTNINDIALLRLNKSVSYSDFIRPICLPLNRTVLAKPGETLYVSAWGWNRKANSVEFKKKISTSLITNDECKRLFKKQQSVGSYQMCTVSFKNNTEFPCLFDNGGSLMFSHKNKWHIEGILTGTYPCSGDKPLKYSKIVKYLNWIQENMRDL